MERLILRKGSLGGLIRSMNVVLTLDEPEFLLLFGNNEPFITKYRTIDRFQRDLMSEQFKGNVVPEYWGVFIIRDTLNNAKNFIKDLVILRGNMTCGKVQYQRDVTEMIRTIPNKYATPGLCLPAGNILTLLYSWIKDLH